MISRSLHRSQQARMRSALNRAVRSTVSVPGRNAQPTDLTLTPISRNDYAALPLKSQPGRPTSFWFDRSIAPTVTVWPVPPIGSSYGFVAYRTRRVMDADPASGETLDAPARFYNAFVCELCAAMSEKFAPAMFKEKVLIATAAWDRASSEDREKVPTTYRLISPGFRSCAALLRSWVLSYCWRRRRLRRARSRDYPRSRPSRCRIPLVLLSISG